jgi:hypothetical protein
MRLRRSAAELPKLTMHTSPQVPVQHLRLYEKVLDWIHQTASNAAAGVLSAPKIKVLS